MTLQTTKTARAESRIGTRQNILEAAGQVFAERGFNGATGKEICDRAGASAGAINYYFGGMEPLYHEVVHEAYARLFSLDAFTGAMTAGADPRARLEAICAMMVRAFIEEPLTAWAVRVISREALNPSPEIDELRERELVPKAHLLRGLVCELMELPQDHPAVVAGCLSIISLSVFLQVGDRASIFSVFPTFPTDPASANVLAHHLVTLTIGGLKAVADDVRRT